MTDRAGDSLISNNQDAGQALVAKKIAKNTIPSANAIARIDWTNIAVAAPGLRPTASDALAPINPTPIAAPRAARPMWILPVIPSANMGINDIYIYLSFF